MTPGEIALVVAVNPRLRKRPWSTSADGSLSGTLGQWRFTIAAFTLAPTRLRRPPFNPQSLVAGATAIRNPQSKTRLLRARISCPYATTLLRNA